MKVDLVKHNSPKYWQLIALRTKILRTPLGLKFSIDELEAENNQLHFGIFKNNIAIACIVLVPQNKGKIKMRQVCIDNHYQGKSLGTFILNHCENYAKENGYNYIHCNARNSAKQFYLKNGYTIKGDNFIEVGIEHYYMFKDL